MKLENYIKRYLKEKNIDINESVFIEDGQITHQVRIKTIIKFITKLDNQSQLDVYKKFEMIDFINGNVMHFIKFIATGMIKF